MNTVIATAVGLLAAEALCKKRTTPYRDSDSDSLSSDSSTTSTSTTKKRSRKRRAVSVSSSETQTQTSSSTLEASLSSETSTSDSSSTGSSTETHSDSDSDAESSSESPVTAILAGLPYGLAHHRSSDPSSGRAVFARRAPLTHRNLHRQNTSTRALEDHYRRDRRFPLTSSVSSSQATTSSASSSDSDSTSPIRQQPGSRAHHRRIHKAHHQLLPTASATSSTTSSATNSPTHLSHTSDFYTYRSCCSPENLQRRLQSFLPAIRASNAELERKPLNIEDTDPDQPHIEMDLGLGVLEERGMSGDEGREVRLKRERERSAERGSVIVKAEEDVLGRAMARGMTPEARERKRRRVGIEVL